MKRHHLTDDVAQLPGAVAKAAAPVAYGAPSNGPWARLFSEPDAVPVAWGVEFIDHGLLHRRIAANLDDAIDRANDLVPTCIQALAVIPLYKDTFHEYRRRCGVRHAGFSNRQ